MEVGSGELTERKSTWRSILPDPLEDRPLAVCDYHSIDPHDLIPVDRVYPEWLQEIYHLRYNPKQRWYWLPEQRCNEPLMFISYDSQSGSNARCKCCLRLEVLHR